MTSSITVAKRTKMLSSITKKEMETQGKKADRRKKNREHVFFHSLPCYVLKILFQETLVCLTYSTTIESSKSNL